MRRLVVFVLVLALLALISPHTLAATPPSGSVSDTVTSTNWSGPIFTGGTYTSGDRGAKCFDASGHPVSPPATAGSSACDVFTLNVNVAASFWTNKAGGVAVRLDNFGANDIDLYVYVRNADGSKGVFVTSSGGVAGQPENAIIDNAAGGYYVVAVAFAVTASSYDGHATFFVTAGHAPTPPIVTNPPGYPAYRASNDVYLSHSEPHIAMNPRNHNNLVAGSKMYVNLANYLFKIGMYASFDGGRTWTDTGQLPGYPTATPSQCTGAPDGQTFSEACLLTTSDVWITFDDEGNAYAMVLYAPGGASSTGWGMNLHKSSDGGRTWGGPIVIHDHFGGLLRDMFLDDKNALAVDNYTQATAPFAANLPGDGQVGTMYSCWNLDDTTSGLHQDIVVSTSMDGGASWSVPEVVSLGQDLEIGCQFAITPSGTVYVSWFHYATTVAGAPGQMFVVRSDDHGLSWTPPVLVGTVNPLPTKLPGSRFRNLSIPAMAASPVDGSVYVTWADYHTANNGTKDGDILVSRSTNGGVTWSAPARVNQDKIGNGKDQFQPQIAVTSSGQVNISYFDRRNDPDNFYIDTYLSRSDDGGAHWSDIRVTQKMWDPSINPPVSGSGEFIGDYQGLVADDDVAIPFWQDTHIGPYQEVYAARVPNIADLTVAGITFSNSKAPEGTKVTITARVANIGYRGATNVKVRFAVDGATQGADQTIASLPAGASANVSIDWSSQGKPGTHTARVTVDPQNAIRESDETNNAGTATFFIKGNKVQNSSFEQTSTSNPSQPANWTPSGTGTRYDVSGGHAADGFAAAGIVAGAVPGQAGKWTSDAIAVVAGAYYDVNATALTGGAAAHPQIVVTAVGTVNGVTGPLLTLTQLVPKNTVTELVGQVHIPAGVSQIVIELREELDSNLTIYYDKIGLYEPD